MTILPHITSVQTTPIGPVRFRSGDKWLHGQFFAPGQTPRAVVVLNPATGVPQRFYRPFAEWLAQTRKVAVLTYDYRDFGASRGGAPMRKSATTMVDWGVHDQQAARDFARTMFPSLPLWVIGHSLGGLTLPFQRNLEDIDRLIAVMSGPVHLHDHPWHYQPMARLFWSWPTRLLVRVLGYFPGRRIGLGADLPKGVFRQWRKWCTTQGGATVDAGRDLPYPDWHGMTGHARFVAAVDDPMVPPRAVWRLMQFYPEAMKSQKLMHPGAYGVEKIGHINVFSPANQAAWPDIVGPDA